MRIVDGQGKIIPDAFAETRISNLPPGVAAVSLASIYKLVGALFNIFPSP